MNLHLATENLALSVAYLRNSRALFVQRKACNIRLDGKVFSYNLLRPELISISLVAQLQGKLSASIQAAVMIDKHSPVSAYC